MQLYHFPSPNPQKVTFALKELGLDCEIIPVDLAKGEHRQPAFLAINPLGRKAPIRWIIEGIAYARHPVTQPVKLYGVTVDSGALPWWYVPGWLVGEYPLAFWLLVALGAWGVVTFLSRIPARAERSGCAAVPRLRTRVAPRLPPSAWRPRASGRTR